MDMKDENKDKSELDVIVAYTQMAVFTLNKSNTEITPKSLKAEVRMLYEKFGNKEVKRLANIIMKEKR